MLAGDVDGFMKRLKSMFAETPYDLIKDAENYFQNAIYLLCTLAGLQVEAEYKTSDGRIDMTIETADRIYVFEFKLDKSAEEAMTQINEKDYLLPFNCSGKKLVKIGVNLSSSARNIDSWIVE